MHISQKSSTFAAKSCKANKIKDKIMARPIRAIPTLYGQSAQQFESAAAYTEANPGTQDYRHQAQVVTAYLQTTHAL